MMTPEELHKLQLMRAEQILDKASKIIQYVRKDGILENKEMHRSMVGDAMALRSTINLFTHTARILEADKGWDELD
ncbi:hypothetical protein LC76P1_00036 [Lysinibacillus phage LC76P1]|nr:hypothetical protein LC76P1_00036 [Lysinibacillus phage LC76P1]